jgi:hypothetical protein
MCKKSPSLKDLCRLELIARGYPDPKTNLLEALNHLQTKKEKAISDFKE